MCSITFLQSLRSGSDKEQIATLVQSNAAYITVFLFGELKFNVWHNYMHSLTFSKAVIEPSATFCVRPTSFQADQHAYIPTAHIATSRVL